jgi:hypothetical protein
MPKYSAYLAVVGHPLVIILIVCYIVRTVCYMVRMVVFLAASMVIIRRADDHQREACLKLAEMTCRPWTWWYPPSRPSK